MASPFTIFRKHRKAFIAALTIMTMFGFVFIPMIMDTMQIGRPKDPVMVTTKKYGKLRQSEVARLVENRRKVAGVLEDALRTAQLPNLMKSQQLRQEVLRSILQSNRDPKALQAAMQPAAIEEAVQSRAMSVAQEWSRETVKGMLGDTKEEAVVETWLFAHRAEELGMQVSEKLINRFLEEIGQKKIGQDQWQAFLERHGLIEKQFFALLRNEMLALRFRGTFRSSLGGITPAQHFDYFSRLKQEATIEALPVRVADYVDDVDTPDEKTVEAFFEQYKNDYDLSTSPTPGFRQHERANVRYFRLVLSQIEKSVTTTAVKEYIEKNKDSLERRYEAAHKKPETKKPEDKKTEDKKAEEKKTEDKTAEKKTEEAKPEEKKPEEGKTEEKKTEDAKPEPEEKPEPKEPAKEPAADKTSARSAGTPVQFAAFMQEAPEAEKTAEKTDEKTPEKTAEKAPAKTEEKPADSAEPPVPEAIKGEGKPGAEKPAAEPKEKPGTEKKPDIDLESLLPEVIKMSKQQWIENEARKELAGQQYRDAVEGLQAAIKTWSAQQRDFEAKTRREPPKPLNFEALCAKYGATSDETGLQSAEEMSELEIARSNDGRNMFGDLIFGSRSESTRAQLSKYQSGVTYYQAGAGKTLALPETVTYVFYKTEDRPEKFVAWEDEGTYDLALAKWKKVQARKKALEAAEALADKARDADKTLKEIFPDRKVVSAGPFTWMTEGVSARLMGPSEPPTLSKVDGIERPGDDFMRAVFALAPGGVGVAMNQPETVAYVVRLEKLGKAEWSLWNSFESTPPGEYGSVAGGDLQAMERAWIEQIKADAGLKWELPPDRPAGSGNAEK